MQSALRISCRAGPGAFSRIVCKAGRRGGAALPPPEPLRRSLSQRAGPSSNAAAGASGSLAAMFRSLREQRVTFRTFSSGGSGGGSSGGGSGGGGGGGSSGGGGGGSGLGALWAAYLGLLEKQPVATKAVSAALLNGLGDAIAQTQFEDGPFDWKRCGIFTFLGLALIGPALHVWYGRLGSLVTTGGNAGAAMRMALDQLCFAPLFISSIVASIMALEGKAGEVPARLRRDLPDIVRSNWLLWVPFQFVNFRFVPPKLQVLMANVVALAWNTYMSWKSHT